MSTNRIKLKKIDDRTYELNINDYRVFINEADLSHYFTPHVLNLTKELKVGQIIKPYILKIDSFWPTGD